MAVSNSTHRPNVCGLIAESFTNTLTIGQNHELCTQGQGQLSATFLGQLFVQPFFARTIANFLDTTSLRQLKVSAPCYNQLITPSLSIALQRLFYEMNLRQRTPLPLEIQHLIQSFLPARDQLCLSLITALQRLFREMHPEGRPVHSPKIQHLIQSFLPACDQLCLPLAAAKMCSQNNPLLEGTQLLIANHQSSEHMRGTVEQHIEAFISCGPSSIARRLSATYTKVFFTTDMTINTLMYNLIKHAKNTNDLRWIKILLNSLDPDATAFRPKIIELLEDRIRAFTNREQLDQDATLTYLINRYNVRFVQTEDYATLSCFHAPYLYFCDCFFDRGFSLSAGSIHEAAPPEHLCTTPNVLEHFIELASDSLTPDAMRSAANKCEKNISTMGTSSPSISRQRQSINILRREAERTEKTRSQ